MIGFRVTNQMVLDHVLTNFQANEQQLQVAEQKVSTGRAFSQPSDAPYDAAQAITFKQRIGVNSQLQRNLDQAHGWLSSTDSALSSLTNNLQRARELAIQASNDTNTPQDRQKIAAEVHQLLLSSVDVANSKFGGQFLFGGTKTTAQPFLHDGSSTSPNVSAGASSPVKYLGDTGSITRQIDSASQLQVNVDGTDFAGLFAGLSQLEWDLNNSTARVSGQISGLDPVNGKTTGNPGTVETFSVNGVAIGSNQNITVNGAAHTVTGFAAGTLLSTIVSQINKQMSGSVTAAIDQNGVLTLQSNIAGSPVIVSNVDHASVDVVTGADLTGGTGVPVSTGGNTVKDLGIGTTTDNAIGSADVVALDKNLDELLSLRARVGARDNRVQANTNRLQSLSVNLAQLDSKIEDVDMAKALSDLATSQTTFQAALGAAAKVLPPTLLDFLR